MRGPGWATESQGPGPSSPARPGHQRWPGGPAAKGPPTAALGSKNMKGRGTRVGPCCPKTPPGASSSHQPPGTWAPQPPEGTPASTQVIHPPDRHSILCTPPPVQAPPPPRQVPQYSGRTHLGRHPTPTQAPRRPEARLRRQRLRSTRAPLVARAAGVLLNERVVLPGQLLPLVLREVLGGVLWEVDVLVLQPPQVGLAHLAGSVHELLREAPELWSRSLRS